MRRRHEDEYEDCRPLLVEFAALDPSDPRRVALRDRLVASYLPLARNIARRFARGTEPLDDLEQVASIGLLKAIDRFEPSQRVEFLAYAVPTIMGEVRRHFRDHTWSVRTPRSLKERHLAVGAATTTLSARLGRAPTSSELAEHLGLRRDEVVEAVAVHGSQRPASLDADLDAVGPALLTILPVGDAGLDRVEGRAVLRQLLDRLPERERRMLVLRFVYDRTQTEIGAELAISQMHVSRLINRAVSALREAAGEVATS